jgi:hypothetical protein
VFAKLWHALVLLACLVGAAVSARLGVAAWDIADRSPEDRVLWWVLAAGCALLVAAFTREIWLRIARLRRPPERP